MGIDDRSSRLARLSQDMVRMERMARDLDRLRARVRDATDAAGEDGERLRGELHLALAKFTRRRIGIAAAWSRREPKA